MRIGPARFPEALRSARLRLARLTARDERDLARLTMDPRVARTIWPWAGGPTRADVHAGLQRALAHWDRHGFGQWLLRDRTTGAMVGRGGLQYTDAPGDRSVEAAWAIVPERWGEGLATELAQAAVGAGFECLGLDDVVALTLPHNVASRRVMEKAGFAYERELTHAGLAHVLYRRPRAPGDGAPGDARAR